MLPTSHSIWAMDHDRLQAMAATAQGIRWPSAAQLADYRKAAAKTLRPVKGRVAVLPLYGVIEQRASAWSYYYGGTSTEAFGRVFNAVMADSSFEAVVIDIDSPGGSSYGVSELSDLIYQARATKPIIGVVNSLCASAGYWIGSSVEQLIATPGGDVGSIGAYMMHVDYSKMYEEAGITIKIIKAGKYKAEGNSYEPLSEEGEAHWQKQCDDCYAMFLAAVARNRGVKVKEAKDNYGEGRCLSADDALAAGIVDRIGTLQQVLGRLTGVSNAAAKNASMEVLRARQAWRKMKAAV